MSDLIPSFSVDHTRIIPGIFVSRVDVTKSGDAITTYDIRLKHPNVEPAIDPSAMHSLEHLIATYLRNDAEWKEDVIYFGPMGCLTGFYLILKGNRGAEKIYHLIRSAFLSVLDAKEVPGNTEVNCGNYLLHNLTMAKWYAEEFVDYLVEHEFDPEIFEYPKTKSLITDKGALFYDS